MTTDRKFSLPINISCLENDRLKLVPLEENLQKWAALYVADANLNPQVYTYLTYGPFASADEYIAHYDNTSRSNPNEILLAILLQPGNTTRQKSSPSAENEARTTTETRIEKETFAGIAGIVAQPWNLIADIGQLLLTAYHRTWVGTEANALLLHHLLDPPPPRPRGDSEVAQPDVAAAHGEMQVQRQSKSGGLGLRRVQWQANASNQASVNAALRLGFKLEGIMRWAAVLPWGKEGDEGLGSPTSVEDKQDRRADEVGVPQSKKSLLPQGWDHEKAGEYGPGRHTAMLAICWDDWLLGGVREKVDALVGR